MLGLANVANLPVGFNERAFALEPKRTKISFAGGIGVSAFNGIAAHYIINLKR